MVLVEQRAPLDLAAASSVDSTSFHRCRRCGSTRETVRSGVRSSLGAEALGLQLAMVQVGATSFVASRRNKNKHALFHFDEAPTHLEAGHQHYPPQKT